MNTLHILGYSEPKLISQVEATDLKAFTQYYYQFTVCNSNKASILGRTKTTPEKNDKVSKVGLAVYSCSNYPFGFFNAYGNPARKDSVDYVIHLGDYIYEYKVGVSEVRRTIELN